MVASSSSGSVSVTVLDVSADVVASSSSGSDSVTVRDRSDIVVTSSSSGSVSVIVLVNSLPNSIAPAVYL